MSGIVDSEDQLGSLAGLAYSASLSLSVSWPLVRSASLTVISA